MAGKYTKPRKLVLQERTEQKSSAVRGSRKNYQPKYGAQSSKSSTASTRPVAKPRPKLTLKPRSTPRTQPAPPNISPARRAVQAARIKSARERRVRIVAVCVLAAVALGVGIWALAGHFSNPYNIKPIPGQDPNAINGTLVQNDRVKVEPGHYRIVINMSPKMSVGSKTCNLNIENVLGNAYTVKVRITDESGGLLYSSGYIQPGQRVESVELETELAVGDHVVTATYFLYNSKTLEESGSTGTAITITVQP